MQEHHHLPILAVAVPTAPLRKRLLDAADELHVKHRLASAAGEVLEGLPSNAELLWCLQAGVVTDVTPHLGTCILLIPVPQAIVGKPMAIPPGGGVPLHSKTLTPTTLLAAVMRATASATAHLLRTLDMFQPLPHDLVVAFVREPCRFRRVQDLRRALYVSRDEAREIVRSTRRYERAEHLFTALRLVLWAFLTSEGLGRSAVENYLGVEDRSHFRRACARARVPVPHIGLILKDLSP